MPVLIEEGKFQIQTVGAERKGVPKSGGKPFRTFDLQFRGDPSWYNCYWTKEASPAADEELEGRKESDEKWGLQFKMKFNNSKANWNPAGANATVMNAAVNLVHDFLSLSPVYLKEWEAKRKDNQPPVQHYLETVISMANQLKQEVVKMGGNEVMTAATASTPPPANGDPGPVAPGVESFAYEGEEERVDLGPM